MTRKPLSMYRIEACIQVRSTVREQEVNACKQRSPAERKRRLSVGLRFRGTAIFGTFASVGPHRLEERRDIGVKIAFS